MAKQGDILARSYEDAGAVRGIVRSGFHGTGNESDTTTW